MPAGRLITVRSLAMHCLLAAAFAAGCQAPIPPPQPIATNWEAVSAMMRLPVIHIWMEVGDRLVPRGSAVVLDEHRLALSLHQLDARGSRLALPGEFVTTYEIEASGADPVDDPRDLGPSSQDWAIIRLPQPLTRQYPAAHVDWERPVAIGDVVYIAGYPYGDAVTELDGLPTLAGEVRGHIFSGRVEPRPRHRNAERGVLHVRWITDMNTVGVSGGAAAVWDEERARPVIVGIVPGVGTLERGGTTADWALVARPRP